MTESARELRFLLAALAVAGLVLLAQLVGWRVHDALADEPTRRELTETCLRDEKGLTLVPPRRDPIAATAEGGAVSTVIETNPVTIVFAPDAAGAERVAAAYRAVGGPLEGRLEVRASTVYIWARVASPTQRQQVYDCQY